MPSAPSSTSLSSMLRCAAGLLGVCLLLSSAPAAGQAVRATASVDSVRIGERFTISLVALHRFNSSVVFPSDNAGPEVFGDLEVFSRTAVSERYLGPSQPGMRVDSITYEVATFALDTARVPPIPVRVAMGSDTVQVRTARLRIPVQSTVSADAQGLRDMAPLATFPGPRWPWILLAIVFLVLVAGLVYFWREWNASSEEEVPSPPPSITPHEAALHRLDALEHHTDWNDPNVLEALFVELSAVVRWYVARRLGLAALERSTAELVQMLRTESSLPAAAVDEVHAMLEQSDLVKFADKRPTSQEGRAALRTARAAVNAIERALPAPQTESASAEASSREETTA